MHRCKPGRGAIKLFASAPAAGGEGQIGWVEAEKPEWKLSLGTSPGWPGWLPERHASMRNGRLAGIGPVNAIISHISVFYCIALLFDGLK